MNEYNPPKFKRHDFIPFSGMINYGIKYAKFYRKNRSSGSGYQIFDVNMKIAMFCTYHAIATGSILSAIEYLT